MVGIFQLLGVSLLFWTFIGCVRFVLETLFTLRSRLKSATQVNLILASSLGVIMGSAIFFLVYTFTAFNTSAASGFSSLSLSELLVWLTSVCVGGYTGGRIYIREPYTASLSVGLGMIACGVGIWANSSASTFIPTDVVMQMLWLLLGVGAAIAGGYVAKRVNIREKHEDAVALKASKSARIIPSDVAVVIAAHNEELSLGSTLESLLEISKPEDIYVGSDGSSDATVEIVRSHGCNVEDIRPNRGKAGALTYVIEKNNILARYKAVFLIDADIKATKSFYTYALPTFDDPTVIAVSGYFDAIWPRHFIPRLELLIPAYRIRLWRVLQFLVRYGQTWKHLNVTPIIPGGGSIYRSSALKEIKIDAPGLIIEDFNMTFEVHRKKLGLIIFEPRCIVRDHEPYSVRDFTKQIRRWYLGYLQTMRRHGIWPSFFCFFTYLFTIEMLFSAILFVIFPLFILELLLADRETLFLSFYFFGYPITLLSIFISFVVVDYLLTVAVAIIERKPALLMYGLAFPFIRYIEAAVFLYSIPLAFTSKNDGKWVSPKRMNH